MWGLRGLAGVMVPALLPLLRMQQGFGGSFPGALESMSQHPGAGPGSRSWEPSAPPARAVALWPRAALAGTPEPGDARGSVWTQRLRVGDPASKDQGRGRLTLRKECLMGLGSLRKWKSQRSRCQAFPGGRAAFLHQATLTAGLQHAEHSSAAIPEGLAAAASL